MARMPRMARTPRMARWLADYPDPSERLEQANLWRRSLRPSRAPVVSFTHYFHGPATQANEDVCFLSEMPLKIAFACHRPNIVRAQ